MASPSTKTDICNLGLRRIGAEGVTVAEITAGTATQAIHCNLQYEQTRDELQQLYWWRFNEARIILSSKWAASKVYTTDQYVLNDSVWYKCATAHTSASATEPPHANWTTLVTATQITPAFEYTYSFDLPSDFLERRYLWEDNTSHRTHYSYDMDASKLYTDDVTNYLVYSKQVTTVASFPPLYIKALYLNLAKNFSTAIAHDGKLQDGLNKELTSVMSRVNAHSKQMQKTKGRRDYYTHNDARRGFGHRIPSQMGS
jgi:hypothetical protein